MKHLFVEVFLQIFIIHIFFIFVFSFKDEPTTMVADLLQMSRYGGTGAEALKNRIGKVFEKGGHLPIQNYNKKMVSFTSDGTSFKAGQNEGLMTKMKRDGRDFLMPIHCVNHRVELAIKDSFDKSPFSAVDKLYITLFNLFKNSEIRVYTLPKLTGTRFVSHCRRASTRLLDM